MPTNFELKAERTLPSLIGVSTPLERRKAIITTARNNPADFSAFFIFALSFAIPLKENTSVTIIAINNINTTPDSTRGISNKIKWSLRRTNF